MALPPLNVRVTADTSNAEAGLKRVDSQMAKTAQRTGQYGKSAQAAAGSTANLAAQFNDIGVMLAAGQSPLLLAVQQGTQINQVMGQMGTTGASRVRALGTAFLSIVSPANLLTLGIIAGGAALVQWGMSAFNAGGDAEDFADSVDALNDIVNRSDDLIEILDSSVSELGETYLDAAGRTREFAAAQAELIASQARSRLEDQIGVLDDVIDAYTEATRVTSEFGTSLDISDNLRQIRRDFGASADEAQGLRDALVELSEAGDLDSQATALQGVLTTLEDMGIPLGDIPPELQRAIDEMITFVREADRADAALQRVAASAAQVNIGVPLYLQNLEGGLLPPSQDEGGGGGGGRSRSGRGGANRAKQQRERKLEGFIEGLQTEREILEEWRAEQLELLQEFTDLELEAIGGKNEAKLRLEEEYQERLNRIQKSGNQVYLDTLQSTLGSVAQILQNGGEKSLKIAKAFGVAEALISTWRGAAKALELPYPQNLAAFAQVLATGFQAVNNIKGVSAGSGSSGGGGSSGAAQPVVNTQRVDINIVGGNDRDRVVAKEVISALNSAQRDGFRLDPRLIGV